MGIFVLKHDGICTSETDIRAEKCSDDERVRPGSWYRHGH